MDRQIYVGIYVIDAFGDEVELLFTLFNCLIQALSCAIISSERQEQLEKSF
jgi:hypothetical protein